MQRSFTYVLLYNFGCFLNLEKFPALLLSCPEEKFFFRNGGKRFASSIK